LNRDTIPGCGCSSGYYDDLVSADCKKCNSKCGECSSFDTCITCATNEEGRTSASKGCKCKSGYFNDNGYCSKCDSKCLSCENKADYCIVCAFGL
jgi:proprotein convertase subtilisin/kexin type 5